MKNTQIHRGAVSLKEPRKFKIMTKLVNMRLSLKRPFCEIFLYNRFLRNQVGQTTAGIVVEIAIKD